MNAARIMPILPRWALYLIEWHFTSPSLCDSWGFTERITFLVVINGHQFINFMAHWWYTWYQCRHCFSGWNWRQDASLELAMSTVSFSSSNRALFPNVSMLFHCPWHDNHSFLFSCPGASHITRNCPKWAAESHHEPVILRNNSQLMFFSSVSWVKQCYRPIPKQTRKQKAKNVWPAKVYGEQSSLGKLSRWQQRSTERKQSRLVFFGWMQCWCGHSGSCTSVESLGFPCQLIYNTRNGRSVKKMLTHRQGRKRKRRGKTYFFWSRIG